MYSRPPNTATFRTGEKNCSIGKAVVKGVTCNLENTYLGLENRLGGSNQRGGRYWGKDCKFVKPEVTVYVISPCQQYY